MRDWKNCSYDKASAMSVWALILWIGGASPVRPVAIAHDFPTYDMCDMAGKRAMKSESLSGVVSYYCLEEPTQ